MAIEHPISEVTADQNVVLDLVCSKVRRLFKGDGCAIMAFTDGEVEVLAAEGMVGPYHKGARFPKEETPAAILLQAPTPLLVSEVNEDERTKKFEWPEEVKSLLWSPVISGEEVVGVLALFSSRADGFDERDAMLLDSLSFQVAVVIRRTRIFREMEVLATTDSLTGLRNFRYFQRRLREEMDRAERYKITFSLALVDIDHMAAFNDRHGFVAGDLLIREVGRILRENTRRVDIVARFGGEEFALLLPETGREGALATAKKLVEAVNKARFVDAEGNRTATITISVGIATYPQDGKTTNDLLAKARSALEEAKRRGGNCAAAPPAR